ncbi:MAG: hypothetical protein R6U37_07100 [Dehalococcoidia bacterium]
MAEHHADTAARRAQVIRCPEQVLETQTILIGAVLFPAALDGQRFRPVSFPNAADLFCYLIECLLP